MAHQKLSSPTRNASSFQGAIPDKITASETVLTMDSSGRQARDVLTEILHHGAEQMLAAAIENEVAEYIDAHVHARDPNGQRLVVRNGHTPTRSILTGLGPVEVTRPRVNDNAGGRRWQPDAVH